MTARQHLLERRIGRIRLDLDRRHDPTCRIEQIGAKLTHAFNPAPFCSENGAAWLFHPAFAATASVSSAGLNGFGTTTAPSTPNRSAWVAPPLM